jgi:hypothetical protein
MSKKVNNRSNFLSYVLRNDSILPEVDELLKKLNLS